MFTGHHVAGYHIQCDFSGDGALLATGDSEGHVTFYDTVSARRVHSVKAHNGPSLDVAFHRKMPSTIATAGWDKQICIYE